MADEQPNLQKPTFLQDVVPPGQSIPSATTRPIIVTNQPLVQDPMMRPSAPPSPPQPAPSTPPVPVQVTSPAAQPVVIAPVAVEGTLSQAPIPLSTPPEETNVPAPTPLSPEVLKNISITPPTLSNKAYFMPGVAARVRRAMFLVGLGMFLIVFLTAASIDIALDAGYIHIQGVHALTHFFSK